MPSISVTTTAQHRFKPTELRGPQSLSNECPSVAEEYD